MRSDRPWFAAALRKNPFLLLSSLAVVSNIVVIAVMLTVWPLSADGERYQEMAVSWLEHGEFRTSDMTLRSPQEGESEAGLTHYFAPLWPLFQAPFYVLLGPVGFEVAVLVALGFSLAAALLTTRHLYGDEAAFAVVACLFICTIRITVQRGGELLALGFFVIMLWSILRSVRPGEGAWILLAGVCAGLAYLTRSSVGWLFLLGGAAGFLWRLRFHQRGALNRHYLGAIAIFGTFWAIWAARNVHHFWDGTLTGLPHALASDAVFEWKFRDALERPVLLAAAFVAKLALGLLLLSPFLYLRRRHLLWQIRNLSDEAACGLFLSWAVPFVMGATVAAVFLLADVAPPSRLASIDNLRYFVFAVPGILWGPTPASAPMKARVPASLPADGGAAATGP